jgi:hypothetical protein
MIFHNGKPRRLVLGVDCALARIYLSTTGEREFELAIARTVTRDLIMEK